ncbi:type II toxin-antitoxin system RelE/ParE family toxin [Endozoicomonas sp. SCSIO W0465]|uniref:type II toxin-antitoxin system RelE/ParE family toxin n=1 Tax=Endozoicomonas sp. SCSIO W0465 TaxID=2918516 RepID=UPI002075C041|nr:type II toxin-antitoxin system RelE/ParE family toxin [Endozoicomonas sp. SCSIO W0465]USE36785.1 type II toxin-antitoxin system RelE/ParE family toxin [Endozoicomonas sp. SCSIO W0465]
MIISFLHKGLERFYRTGKTSGIQAQHAKKLKRILLLLNRAKQIGDLDIPGFRLHPLKGERKGIWSVTVSGNWRVTFRFNGNDAEIINYEDYH